MLHINKIIVKNFRPYNGIQTFDFGDKDGLSIIIGDNGIGKSSLIRAIKFVLYNELESTDTFKIKNELNILAWEEENYEMYVALDFTYNNDSYILKRINRLKGRYYGEPQKDDDFEDVVTLIRNRNLLSQNEMDIVLKNIIPKKISEYILFEGETISKYKDLLDKNRNLEIYESIRRILGVTTLENTKIDLDKHLEKLNQEKIKLVKEQSKNEKLKEELDNHQEHLSKLTTTRKNIEEDYQKTKSSREKNEEILRNNQRIKELLEDKSKLKTDINVTNNEISIIRESLKTHLKNYKSICYGMLKNEVDYIPNDIENVLEKNRSNETFREKIKTLEEVISTSKCMYCGHALSQSEIEDLKGQIQDLTDKLHVISPSNQELINKHKSKTSVIASILNQIQFVDFGKIVNDIETQIQTKLIEKDNKSQKLSNIDSQIESLGGSQNIEIVARNYSNDCKNEELLKQSLEQCDKNIKEIKEKIDDILKKNPTNLDLTGLENKITKTSNLINVFIKAIDKFSEQMRLKVQEDATLMFKNISENTEYDHLEFDEQYGLKLKDRFNRIVPNISSGYMTLITISLIYGLHKNSSLTGTIILDAPFSVLTNFHRDRIIRTFQTLSPQVILLVYKDQINIETIRKEMQGKLINEFEIYQNRTEVNSSYKTNIREVVI